MIPSFTVFFPGPTAIWVSILPGYPAIKSNFHAPIVEGNASYSFAEAMTSMIGLVKYSGGNNSYPGPHSPGPCYEKTDAA